MNTEVFLQDLGLRDYKEIWDYQQGLLDDIVKIKMTNRKQKTNISTPNYFLLVEHPHVYTLGKSGDISNLLIANKDLEKRGISFYKINRGGDITYHGPGQVVGYPILDLENFFTDINRYLRQLEDVIIRTLKDFGIKAMRSPGETGVWLDADTPSARKICAMGIRSSRWITMHGFALNVNNDLRYFNDIIPCGIKGKAVTSVRTELGVNKVSEQAVKDSILKHFKDIFQVQIKEQHNIPSKDK